VKSSTGRTSPLTTELPKPAKAKKHMDDEMLSVFLLCDCEIRNLNRIVCFFKACSV
jgi:hypothetical protein